MPRLIRLFSASLKNHSSPIETIEAEVKVLNNKLTLREKYSCSEFFWSEFSLMRTEYGEIRSREMYYLSGEGAISTETFRSNSHYFLSIKFGKKLLFNKIDISISFQIRLVYCII